MASVIGLEGTSRLTEDRVSCIFLKHAILFKESKAAAEAASGPGKEIVSRGLEELSLLHSLTENFSKKNREDDSCLAIMNPLQGKSLASDIEKSFKRDRNSRL